MLTSIKNSVLIDLTTKRLVVLNRGDIMNLQLKRKDFKAQAFNKLSFWVLQSFDDKYKTNVNFKHNVDCMIKFWESICQ